MEIRLMGSQPECTTLAELLQTMPGIHVTDVSRPYPNRHDPATVRIYLDVVPTGTVRADAAVNDPADLGVRARNLPAPGDARA